MRTLKEAGNGIPRMASTSYRLFCSSLLLLSTCVAAFGEGEVLKPTWETQRQARTYVLAIPGPRGQISDRHGEPLAQTRLSYQLAISFPTPTDFSDSRVLSFAEGQIAKAQQLTGRQIKISGDAILRHYHNRGLLPLDIAQDLTAKEVEAVQKQGGAGLITRVVYLRTYPHGALAAHILGYATKEGRQLDSVLQNNDLLWPDTKGREGLEATFNDQLTGKPGQLTMNVDAQGRKAPEKVTLPPESGYNVVTTLDLTLQKLCEKALAEGVKRGALVVMDPNNGDILAMASWPSFDPNMFIPSISEEQFKVLSEDKNNPLIPRAYRSMYPPGSVFKMISGIAALETGKVTPETELPGPPSLEVGNIVMRNWKKTHAGMLTFSDALEQSCNTWFYQVGLKVGSKPLIDCAERFGFGAKTGIPLRAEAEGRVPNSEYMRKTQGRNLSGGDIANMSIGQGGVLVTPLQIAQSMAVIANGGTFYQTRLVRQVQSLDDQITTGYEIRIKDQLGISKEIIDAARKGMVLATNGGRGTGHRASLNNIVVAGKTGTAQWGPKDKERYAAWYAGFAPADKPQYAFAVVYESDPLETKAHGGTVAAPIMGKVLKELFPEKSGKGKKSKPKPTPPPSEDESD